MQVLLLSPVFSTQRLKQVSPPTYPTATLANLFSQSQSWFHLSCEFLLLKFRQCEHHSEQSKHYFGPLTLTKLRQTRVFRACFPTFLLIRRCGFFIDNFRNRMKLFRSTVAEMIVLIFSPASWILCFPSPFILRTLFCIQSQIKHVLTPKLLSTICYKRIVACF